jgi:hypothetical protein
MSPIRVPRKATDPAKVGKRYPTFEVHQPVTTWRRSMASWVLLALGAIGGSLAALALALLWRVFA